MDALRTVAARGFTIWGAKPERRRREDRGAEGAETETETENETETETETPKALREKGMGRASPAD